ncbi:hypothetical protein KOW79_009023 [Hemibagrus wyckioides]|uniref:Uncharacterized protein n=1 Tax=Hemibagrus wyckioides TaxID=337641 RepID=A0A9D3NSD9_9TELE|nr:hypothetical protein KOW79_009023 [Hemibagrus wyckioides]
MKRDLQPSVCAVIQRPVPCSVVRTAGEGARRARLPRARGPRKSGKASNLDLGWREDEEEDEMDGQIS